MRINTGTDQSAQDPYDRYAAAKLAVAEAEKALAEAKQELVDHMLDRKTKTHVIEGGTKRRSFTLARQNRVSVDEVGLSSAIGVRAFNKYAPRKFDKKLLEADVEIGKIEAEVVAPFITVTQGDPYIVMTESEVSDE